MFVVLIRYKTSTQENVAWTCGNKNNYDYKRDTVQKKKIHWLQYRNLEQSENDENTEVFEAAAVSTL